MVALVFRDKLILIGPGNRLSVEMTGFERPAGHPEWEVVMAPGRIRIAKGTKEEMMRLFERIAAAVGQAAASGHSIAVVHVDQVRA